MRKTQQSATTWPDSENPCPAGWRLPTSTEVSNLLSNTYTTRSWVTGIGADKGLKVVTKAVGSVTAGKELWFPNAGYLEPNGTIDTTVPPGQGGWYWTSTPYSDSSGYFLRFYYYSSSDYRTGHLHSNLKLRAQPIRCVR